MQACRNLVYADSSEHLTGMRILGVDEHVWKHTRRPGEPSSMVTVLVNLTPLVDGHGPARLIDMRPGRRADVLKTWLTERDPHFRDGMQVVTSGTGSPGTPPLWTMPFPRRGRSWTKFHVVHLAAEKLTGCRQHLQRETTGRRGHKDDPLYKHRRSLLTRMNYLTDRERQRLDLLWSTDDDYAALQVTWGFYQEMIAAYGHPRKAE
ncbi:transposase [Corynebacterium sp. CNJ-954]|uniref:transposase n=1 Tax=Corynebacterium sp. CNJ-954 TaxID=1904962 RepID=UPI0009FA40E7